jgi:predicted NUDIX family phosphoesterase
MSSKDEEQVLVVPAALIESIGAFEGFCPDVDRYLPSILDPTNQSFIARKYCETDPSFKQLIPYVVLISDDASDPKIFRYTRGSGQTEARLHAKQSIGIGGHIAIEDCSGSDLYRTGMQRELYEEMDLGEVHSDKIVGLIYDSSNAVGTVHLGIVHKIKVRVEGTKSREDELIEAGFRSFAEIENEYDRLESWSQLAFHAMFRT